MKKKKKRDTMRDKSAAPTELASTVSPQAAVRKKRKRLQHGRAVLDCVVMEKEVVPAAAVVLNKRKKMTGKKKRKVTRSRSDQEGEQSVEADHSERYPPRKKKKAKTQLLSSHVTEDIKTKTKSRKEKPSAPSDEKWQEDRLTVFVGNMPADIDEDTVRRDFEECGKIERFRMPTRSDGKYKGLAFITYADEKDVEEALKHNGEDYGGRILKVKMSERHSKDDTLKVFVGGLPWATKVEKLKNYFEECGGIARFDMPLDDNGKCKGVAFITYKTKEAAELAVKRNGQQYEGRNINVKIAENRRIDNHKGNAKGNGNGKGKGRMHNGKNGKNNHAPLKIYD